MKQATLALLTCGAIASLLGAGGAALDAADKKPLNEVQVDALIAETQKSIGGAKSLNLVWIVPVEYWEVFLSKEKNLTEAQRRKFTDTLDRYLLVGLVRGDISDFGAIHFHEEEKVFAAAAVTFAKPGEKRMPMPLLRKADNEDAQRVIELMKPTLRAALGTLGENFHFFVCHSRDPKGTRLVSPYAQSKLSIKLSALGENQGGLVDFDFPLDSLHLPRTCGQCGKQAHISWSYCPFCGKKHAD